MKKFILLFSLLLVIFDQIIKSIVISSIELYDLVKVIPNFFYITYIKNDGAAFSLFSGSRWLLVSIAVIAIIFMIRFIFSDRYITKYDVCAYSLIFSGIVGNLIDRIFYGSVIDYLSFYIFGYSFPIFNFADICIVIGVFMILYTLFFRGDLDENIHSRKGVKWFKNR